MKYVWYLFRYSENVHFYKRAEGEAAADGESQSLLHSWFTLASAPRGGAAGLILNLKINGQLANWLRESWLSL